VVKKFSKWKSLSAMGGEESIVLITEVIIEIRKDMGNQNTTMDMHDLWRMLITDYDNIKPNLILAQKRILDK